MKVLLALSAAFLYANALPANFTKELSFTPTIVRAQPSIGFASFGGGTRGGQAGTLWTVWDPWSLRNAIVGTVARIIYVRGRIDLTPLFLGSPGIYLDVGSFKTIIGGDANAEIIGGGFRISGGQQVIIQNIKFSNAISYAPGEQPNGVGGIINQLPGEFTEINAVLVESTEYVWIDHNEFSDDPWIANTVPNDRLRHGSFINVFRGSNYVTVSNNIFRNHNRNIQVGHSDTNGEQDFGKLKTSFMNNWFQGTIQCNPTVRWGEVHVLNNLYTDIVSYGIGAGAGANIYAERNLFVNSRAWRHPEGTPNPIGYLLNVDNRLVNSNYNSLTSNGVRWTPSRYYWYSPIPVAEVEKYVRDNAGTWLKHFLP